jgi:hypothetical protein
MGAPCLPLVLSYMCGCDRCLLGALTGALATGALLRLLGFGMTDVKNPGKVFSEPVSRYVLWREGLVGRH